MFKNLKEKVTQLSYAAVNFAENTLASETGKEKKNTAIAFIVNRLTIPAPIKPIVILILTGFIDQSIEIAVTYMKSIRNEDR